MFGRQDNTETESDAGAEKDPTSSESVTEGQEKNFESDEKVSAFVGPGGEFKGIINYQGTIRIDGRLEGEVRTTGTLLVGREATISAKIEAGRIICQGHVIGDMIAHEKAQLLAPAVVNGSVKAPILSIEEGVVFDGTCEMGSVGTPQSKHREEATQETILSDTARQSDAELTTGREKAGVVQIAQKRKHAAPS